MNILIIFYCICKCIYLESVCDILLIQMYQYFSTLYMFRKVDIRYSRLKLKFKCRSVVFSCVFARSKIYHYHVLLMFRVIKHWNHTQNTLHTLVHVQDGGWSRYSDWVGKFLRWGDGGSGSLLRICHCKTLHGGHSP